ncbi:autotransporter family protein [Pandoraea sputorum]|uniref:Outer membrane autotransporter n=1 Tax=Pandoraea sputorum TaxID=93222 RepID=A0A5E5BKI2_9BURK|nr:autotransporter outer membrane beta-barrel domain-containing protein [Pandoraea sputorum]VVE85868.1 outer membrane autotransporter [Pandoraea sputorum]
MNARRATIAAAAACMLILPVVQAGEIRVIEDARGRTIFRARFFGIGDGVYGLDQLEREIASSWSLSTGQQTGTVAGLAYWAHRLVAVPGASPAIVNIGTIADRLNAGQSPLAPGDGASAPLQVQAVLEQREAGGLQYGAHGTLMLGTVDFSAGPYLPSQLARGTGTDLPAIVVHELAHALGITTSVDDAGDESVHNYQPRFAARISDYTAHLRDDNGRPARARQVIYCNGCANPASADAPFDVRGERGYFTGANVDAVLAGSGLRGVPVRVSFADAPDDVDTNYMSHLELKHSLMSHQSYRNYTGFMEAELAVLQDLGYSIDRRNFFGRSVYGDHQVLVNDAPYFSRNDDGTAYVPNTYNTAVQGLGLHVYGSYNTILQRADLLTRGAGGAGIRIDGRQNDLVVLPGTRVYADGAYARGVMFAYGRDHTFTLRGDVQALGEHGIAASFDFGNNPLGNVRAEYRGSYFSELEGIPQAPLPEHDGPLVEQFDLTGRLAGSYAAIFLSDSGYVHRINVMQGATLLGDILSEYSRPDASGHLRLTELTFGQAPDAGGHASGLADPTFSLQYDGNMVGRNLSVLFAGGSTRLRGNHVLYDARVAPGATLTGNGSFTLTGTPAQLVNSGTLAPQLTPASNTLTLNGDFVQTSTGTLRVGVNGAGALSQLIVNGNAMLDGALAITPLRSWYGKNFSLRSDQWVVATRTTGAFGSVSAPLASPTLTAVASPLGDGAYRIEVTRALNAYSRYAADPDSQRVGGALDRLADTASPPLQPLVAALDFSAADGHEVRSALRQLSPGAYGAMFTGALLRERQITELVAAAGSVGAVRDRDTGRNTDARAASACGDWRTFAMPFGAGYWRGGTGDIPGANGNIHGVVFGAECDGGTRGVGEGGGWTLGMHGAISGQSTRLAGAMGDARGTGKTTALDVGVHARYADEAGTGPHAFAALRAGVEDGQVDRSVSVAGYTGTARGNWTGASVAASFGGGWRWALSPATDVGPIAALDYAMMTRPGVSETGGSADGGMRLTLDGLTFHSLRSRLGAALHFGLPASVGAAWHAHLQATWDHELLSGALTQGATFTAASAARFTTRTTVTGRDSLGVQAGVSYRAGERMTLGAALLCNLYAAGDADIAGSVAATWRF